MRTHIIVLMGAAALIAPIATAGAAHAQGLNALFDCNNPGNKQGSGALIGGLLGGLAGNQIADHDRTSGTVIGGLLGAAAGSAIGCKMSSADTSRASAATQQALDTGTSRTWSNPNNGTSGRIDIVDTFDRGDASARVRDRYSDRYDRTVSLGDVRFDRNVERPVNYNYNPLAGRYQAKTRVNVRSGPSTRAPVLMSINNGDEFDAVARVNGGWILAVRDGRALGYVSTDVVGPSNGQSYASNGRYDSGETCRVFDQTVAQRGYGPTTQRFTACRRDGGEWVIQS